MIRDLVACEHAYINTDHPSFVGGNRAIAQVLEQRCASSQSAGSDEEPSGNGSELPHGRSRSTGNLPQQSSSAVGHNRQSSRGAAQDASAATSSRQPKVQLSSGMPGSLIPELFRPEDLLGSSSVPATAAASAPQPTRSEADIDEVAKPGWLTGFFGSGSGKAPAPQATPKRSTKPALHQPPSTLRVPTGTTEQEEVQVEVTRVLVESYFDLVRKNLQDAVPKAVMHFLVGAVQRGMQQHLIHTLYREELFEDMIRERPDVASKRDECRMALRALKDAVAALESLPADLISRINAAGVAESEAPVAPRRTSSTNVSQFVVRSSSGALARMSTPMHMSAGGWA
jgi:dynamin 1-like protein